MPRLGLVAYSNVSPFRYGLRRMGVEFLDEVPAKLLPCLESGEVEAAIVPTFDVLAHPALIALPGTCIASDGPAMSVKLFSRIPPRFAERVALDADSHTSVALTRVLFDSFGAHPQYLTMPPDLDQMLTRADAALLIGDPCLRAQPAKEVLVTDLGEAWKELTGLPFVFALWAAREGADYAALNTLVLEALKIGLDELPTVAEEEATRLGLKPETMVVYLRDSLRYHLDESYRAGLERFRQMAQFRGLLDSEGPVRFALA
jgi:chorismate dehydratase